MVSPATHLNGTDAAIARAIIRVASFGLVAKPASGGTYAASRRSGSSVQRTIDERMTVARNVGSEDSDLAVRDLACGASVLPRHSARRLALLEKAGLVDHEHRVVIRQMLDDIIAYDIAQGISIPIHATQDRLLPPWAGIASRLRAHPTGLALLISEQAFQEQTCIRRNTLLPEQRTYPLLDLPKRRRPQRKRLLNRRCPRPRSSNHGCPWIQNRAKKATVMLGRL